MNIICAYPVNLDAVYNVNGEELARFCSGVNPEIKERINSIEDLISALLFYMLDGSGDELLIEREEVARRIEANFQWNYRLGGNAGIMSNVLATLGAETILNAPALSCRIASMLHPKVRVPVAGELREPLQAAGEREMVHFVFQFAEGEAVITSSGKIMAPRDNRLIATFDPLNSQLYSDPDFDAYCQKWINNIDGALVSGFHLVPFLGFKKILDQKIAQIKSWRDANPSIYIHAEMGSFQRTDIMRHLLQHLPVDSLGLNEDELARAVSLEPGWRGTLEAAKNLKNDLGLVRVAVHTRDYIISIMEDLIPAEKEVFALTRGADLAAAFAATGKVNDYPPDEVNPEGLKARTEFCQDGANACGRGAYRRCGDSVISFVPSLLSRHPKFTVGLGDTTTAAIFYEEVLATRKCRTNGWKA